jgi:hypothetical protein
MVRAGGASLARASVEKDIRIRQNIVVISLRMVILL